MPNPATFPGEGLGQAFQRPLGGVVDAQVGEGGDPADAGDLHDVPAALLTQEGDGSLGDPQSAEEVGLQLRAGLVVGGLLDRAEVAVACVVDDHVETAEPVVRGLYGGDAGGPVGDIQLDR